MYVTVEERNGPVTISHELRTCKTFVLYSWDLDLRYVLPVMESVVCPEKTGLRGCFIRCKNLVGGRGTGESWERRKCEKTT